MRAAVQHHAADELHVEVPHVEDAPAGFAHDRERFGQQRVERFAAALGAVPARARPQHVGLRPHLRVAQLAHGRLRAR